MHKKTIEISSFNPKQYLENGFIEQVERAYKRGDIRSLGYDVSLQATPATKIYTDLGKKMSFILLMGLKHL